MTPTPPDAHSRRRLVVLAIGVFVSGAVLLGMEIAASRVVAPFFGNSLFVWGALIGVVLTGLMIGYWVGGVAVDRAPARWLLVSAMGLGALGVLLIPLLDGPVLEFVVRWDPGPRLNPLVAATLLFGPPSVVLASATPIAVRLVARSMETLGRTSGGLFSISTAGSIFGTYATAFFLIPEFGTDQLLAISATVLALACGAVALSERVWPALVGAAVLAVSGAVAVVALAPEGTRRLSAAEATNWSPVTRERGIPNESLDKASKALDAVFAKDTEYHRLMVTEDDANRYLRFDNSFQSGMLIADPFESVFPYETVMLTGLAYRPQTKRVLHIGLGGGSIPKRMWRDFPELQLDVVELDKEVVTVARRFFALPDDPRLDVHVDDGRQYLLTTDETFDMIVIDAFFSDSIPAHLATREFVELAKSRLARGGAVVMNIIGAMDGEQSKLFRAIYRTYAEQFPTLFVHPVDDEPGPDDDDQVRNIVLVATDGPRPDGTFLNNRWDAIRRDHPTAPDLRQAIETRREAPVPVDDVPTLTDDYAPTDALLLVL